MIVTARMVCETITLDGAGERVVMRAITNGHPEDNSYSKWTPSGTFEIYVSNPDIHGHFKPGEVYDFKITHHEKSS